MLLIPIETYSIQYLVASRRQYFELDCLLLWAIGREKIDDINSLQNELRLPYRLLMEALLRLLEDGWIGVPFEGSERFMLSAKARRWLAKYSIPSRGMRLDSNSLPVLATDIVARERITGALIRREKISLVTKNMLDEQHFMEHCHTVPPEIPGSELNKADLQTTVRTKAGEWVTRIEQVTPAGGGNELYLPVGIAQKDRVFHLPRRWRGHLIPVLVEFARSRNLLAELEQERVGASAESRHESLPFHFSAMETDILTRDEPASVVRGWLENATRNDALLWTEPRANSPSLRQWQEPIRAALLRGASIDFVWNADAPEAGVVLAVLSSLVAGLEHEGARRRFRFNHQPLPVHTCLLAWVRNDRSCEFLLCERGMTEPNVGETAALRIDHPQFLAAVLQIAGRFLNDSGDRRGSLPEHRWLVLSAHLGERPARQALERERNGEQLHSCSAGMVFPVDLRGAIFRILESATEPVAFAGPPAIKEVLQAMLPTLNDMGIDSEGSLIDGGVPPGSLIPLAASRTYFLFGPTFPPKRREAQKELNFGILVRGPSLARRLSSVLGTWTRP